jgi:hypothetical protein
MIVFIDCISFLLTLLFLLLLLVSVNQFDYFLLKAITIPCMVKKKLGWNALVMGLRVWYSVRAWDGIFSDGTIGKEIQANRLDKAYHDYALMLAPPPKEIMVRILEHHDRDKAYTPGVKLTGESEYRKTIMNKVTPYWKCDSGGDYRECVANVFAAHHKRMRQREERVKQTSGTQTFSRVTTGSPCSFRLSIRTSCGARSM